MYSWNYVGIYSNYSDNININRLKSLKKTVSLKRIVVELFIAGIKVCLSKDGVQNLFLRG